MANKTLNTRILLKTDTKANWEKAAGSFIPKAGEVCIYSDRIQTTNDAGETVYIPGIKVGDGVSYIDELEFMGDEYISKKEIDEILGTSSEENTSSNISLVSVTFPQLDPDILSMGNIDATDKFYFSTLDVNGKICTAYRYFWDVCLYEDKRTIQVLPNTYIICYDNHWISFVDSTGSGDYDGLKHVESGINNYAAYVTKNTILNWDGPM